MYKIFKLMKSRINLKLILNWDFTMHTTTHLNKSPIFAWGFQMYGSEL